MPIASAHNDNRKLNRLAIIYNYLDASGFSPKEWRTKFGISQRGLGNGLTRADGAVFARWRSGGLVLAMTTLPFDNL